MTGILSCGHWNFLGLEEGLGFEAADHNQIMAVVEFRKLENPGLPHP